MKKLRALPSAFTLTELIVVLVIIGVLIFLAIPRTGTELVRGQMTQTLSNMKQLHLATQQMMLDSESTTNVLIGWPGDTGGSFSNWARQLTDSYLLTNDFCKLLSAPGVIVAPGKIPTASERASVLYAVGKSSPDTAVFLNTANFTNSPSGGQPLEKAAVPYGDKGFVVFRKGGDGAILLARQVGQTNIIGTFVPPCAP